MHLSVCVPAYSGLLVQPLNLLSDLSVRVLVQHFEFILFCDSLYYWFRIKFYSLSLVPFMF